MALPSGVTVASLAFVVAAGAGFVVLSTSADAGPPLHHAAPKSPATGPRVTTPKGTHHHQAPAHHQPAPDAVPSVLVVVYNNAGISGLAARKAALLEGAGWKVAATDNWYGNIVDNTVYYPPTLKPAAVKLAKALHITRLRPAVSPMQFDRLTVIFTSA